MTPEEELAQLRHRLIGLFYVICGDVRNVSKGDRSAMHNFYSATIADALAEVDKVHKAYVEFFRAQIKAAREAKK